MFSQLSNQACVETRTKKIAEVSSLSSLSNFDSARGKSAAVFILPRGMRCFLPFVFVLLSFVAGVAEMAPVDATGNSISPPSSSANK
jgi:hypothetical protein